MKLCTHIHEWMDAYKTMLYKSMIKQKKRSSTERYELVCLNMCYTVKLMYYSIKALTNAQILYTLFWRAALMIFFYPS